MWVGVSHSYGLDIPVVVDGKWPRIWGWNNSFLTCVVLCRSTCCFASGYLTYHSDRNWDTHAGLEHKILCPGLWGTAQQLRLHHKRVQSIWDQCSSVTTAQGHSAGRGQLPSHMKWLGLQDLSPKQLTGTCAVDKLNTDSRPWFLDTCASEVYLTWEPMIP